MQTHCSAEQLECDDFDGHKAVADFDGGAITSDAGALLLRHADGAIGLFERVSGRLLSSFSSGNSRCEI